jgi:hypothetical protein
MKNIQSIEDIKEASSRIILPSIDVRENVMEKITALKDKPSIIISKKLITCMVISVCLFCALGFVVFKALELKDSYNSSYRYEFVFKGGEGADEQAKQIQTEWEKINQGEALAILYPSVKDNPANKILILNKYKPINDLGEIKRIIGENFKAPISMPTGYKFYEGQVGYNTDEQLRNDMIEEGKISGNSMIIKTVKSSNSIYDYSLKFKNGGKNEIYISAFYGSEGIEQYESYKDKKATQIEVNKSDGIYTKNSGMAYIMWTNSNNGKKVVYQVACASEILTKDELLNIAESLK